MSVWTKEEIKDLLVRNDKAVCKAVVAIWNKQTEDEKIVDATREHNGIGFNGADATFMSSLAKQFVDRGFLTPRQITYARKKIMKYSGQLEKIANGVI